MTTRKTCVNVSTASYSGKEQSPLHYGLSAEGYELNTVMNGYDNLMWVVKIKNNRKVWVRQTTSNKMFHEDPVMEKIDNEIIEIDSIEKNVEEPKLEVLKPVVEEKKTTDYNLFLTYRLQQIKKEKPGANKEVFNSVVAEWKELKKNPTELKKIIINIKDSLVSVSKLS